MQRNNNQNNKQQENIKIESLEILRAHDGGKNMPVYFDMKINGITVYGCRVVAGQHGDFIAFPSQKGSNDKWYNIVWIPLSQEDQKKIIEIIENML